MSHLQMLGSPAYEWIPGEKRNKLEAKSRKLLLVGYSSQHKAYRFLNPNNDKLTVSRDCRFLPLNEVRSAEPQKGRIVDYPFRLLEHSKAEVPVIPAKVDESEDESDESDLLGFETSYDDANE
ncbi:uncharacterized protein LOC135705409 [Ochlerotatus camptorhynchus]|uniref:uncharacterized protein LOC135705409 n=1 Tax=Ochlerotatus camptorhynchus TaxID=644619 RepID=UPI0031E2058A